MEIRTTEMHTGGEPLRVVEAGYPPPEGATLLDKRRHCRQHLDHLRRRLMQEPRGHRDMYGALLVEPDDPAADLGVLFIHTEGYSTMCGHGVIALGRYAVDKGLVRRPLKSPEVQVNIQCPCGLVPARVEYDDVTGKTGRTSFTSVPAFAMTDVTLNVHELGEIRVDVGYGGAFYVVVEAQKCGIDLEKPDMDRLRTLGDEIKRASMTQVTLTHPESSDLAFMYGVIFTDGKDQCCQEPTQNIIVFGDKQIDRSPCGSGVTARVAVQFSRGQIGLQQRRGFIQPQTGSEFTAMALEKSTVGDLEAVTVEVTGQGHYTGSAIFTVEEDDHLKAGFLLN